jgi:hypothetical protein
MARSVGLKSDVRAGRILQDSEEPFARHGQWEPMPLMHVSCSTPQEVTMERVCQTAPGKALQLTVPLLSTCDHNMLASQQLQSKPLVQDSIESVLPSKISIPFFISIDTRICVRFLPHFSVLFPDRLL